MSTGSGYVGLPGGKPEPEYQSLCFFIWATSVYALSSFYFGYSMVYFNAIPYPTLSLHYSIRLPADVGEGLFSGCIAFGGILGAAAQKKVLMHFGRRDCFFFSNSLALLGGMAALFPNMYLLLLGRVLQGFVVGLMSGILSIMIKELTPISIYGITGALPNFFIACGFLFAFVLSYVLKEALPESILITVIFGFTMVTTLLQQAMLKFVLTNETPKYLLQKGRDEEARELIAQLYRPEVQEDVYQQKLRDFEEGREEEGREEEGREEEGREEEGEEHPMHERPLPKDSPQAKFLAIFFAVFQQLSGINVIVLYGGELAEGFFPTLKEELPILIQFQKLVLASGGVWLLRCVGRKSLMQAGIVLIIGSLLGVTAGFWMEGHASWDKDVIFASFLVFIAAFATTFGPIMWLYIPEIVQPSFVPVAIICHWVACCSIITLFPIVRGWCHNINCPWIFLFLGVCMGGCAVVIRSLMVETQGKTESQIREQFRQLPFPCA